jgi:ferredoxin
MSLRGREKLTKARFTVTYITPENKRISVKAAEGENLLDVAHSNDIDLEGNSFY